MVPTLFHRVQLGRVQWQRLKGKPRRMVFLKIRRRWTMHVPTVPYHDHVTPIGPEGRQRLKAVAMDMNGAHEEEVRY